MFKEKFNKSIRFKFLSIISVILFVSTLVLSLVIAINEERVVKNSLRTTGQSFASYIAKLGRDPLITKDSIQLDAIVTDANKDENIAYAIIRDGQGTLLTSQYASINYRLPEFNAILLELSRDHELQDIIDAIKKKESVIEVSIPIMIDIKTIGAVTIGMSARHMHQEIVKTILFVIALNVAVAFVLGAVLFVASKKIVFNPLIELAYASSRLAKGDLSTEVKVRTTGEVKTLVDSFNEMVKNLEKVTVSKDYVDSIIRSMINTLIVVSPDDKIIRTNEAACRLLGYEEEEFIGRPAETIFGGERSLKDSWMKTMLADGRVSNIEESYRAKNGREFPVLFSASVMRDDNNLFRGAVYVAQDITERKRAEEALYTEKQRFQTLTEQAPFGMVMIEQDGTFRYINPKFRELFGYELTDVPDGKTWFRKAYPDPTYRHHVIGTWIRDLEVFKPGEKRFKVFTVTCKDGTEKIINFIPVQLATGENLMACENITERKQAEEALQRSEAQANQLAQENALIAEIGRIISSTPNIEEVYPLFSQKVKELIPFDRIAINLINLKEGTHMVPYVAGPSVSGRQPGDMAPIVGTLLEKVLQSQEGIIIRMESEDEVAAEVPGLLPDFQEGFRSGLTVPLISGGEVIGGLALRSKGMGVYTDRDLRLAESIGNQIAGAIANAQLYTEQRRVEEVLRENEAIFSSFLEHSPVYVFFKDKNIRSLRLSKNYEQLLRMPIHQALGKTMDELFPSELAKSMVADDLRILTEGERVVVVEELHGRIYETTKFPIFKDDRPFMLAGFTVDITEQKRAEEALRTSEEKFKAAFEGSHDAITITTEKGEVLDCNQRALEVFGLDSKDEFSDQRPADFSPPFQPDGRDSYMASREQINKVLNGGGATHFEWVHQRLNGETFPAEIILTSYQFKGETVLQATIRDITERKRAEEEKQRLEERLSRAKKMEALGTLSGGVAHDLNNVLGVLAGYSELLLMEMGETHPLRSHVSYILQASQKAAAIIQDLLTLARRGVSVSQVVNLNDVISNYLKTPEFEKLKSYHPNVTFKSKLEKDLLNVKGSPVHLEKTVMNLLSNAAEAISRSHGEVTLMTENRYLDKPVTGYDEIREGDYVVLRVSDNGKGISTADIGKIFEPFYTKKVMGRSGTGLGLAVVWGTVKDHGGYIDVQSEEGRGSTFTVYFPVTREEMVSDQKGVSAESYRGRGESILVVDDVKEQRDLATAMLNSLGYRVSAVSSGEEAVAYLQRNTVDLLVLDMIMDPGMDGLETYQRVLEINPKQKAIIVSGFSETDRVKKAQELGAGAYVKKPYVQEKIGFAIRRELDK